MASNAQIRSLIATAEEACRVPAQHECCGMDAQSILAYSWRRDSTKAPLLWHGRPRCLVSHEGVGAIIPTMRTSPVIGRKTWFAPRRFGWGLGPVTPEGWVVTVIFTGLAVVLKRWESRPRWARYVMFAAFVAVLVLKGSSPGGAAARSEFNAARAAERQSDELKVGVSPR
jgi:hypothetical protein